MLPNALAQFGARKDAARTANQQRQQHYLPRRQLDLARAAAARVVYQLEREIADAQEAGGFLRITASERTHARNQFLHGKWLCQIIVRAELQSSHTICDLPTRGEDENTAGHMLRAQPA